MAQRRAISRANLVETCLNDFVHRQWTHNICADMALVERRIIQSTGKKRAQNCTSQPWIQWLCRFSVLMDQSRIANSHIRIHGVCTLIYILLDIGDFSLLL
jgi:hypothetical protein